ncbi:hypothetical protein CH362_18880 [Leptospira saintgironsiae]|uniref:Uncharacterized protein n=1 Tax=Leptospira saintgironsiae TaxID=2023183 RepID=A0A2M9Y7R9_9LEPT|nr:hypothetical protein CH362_18880 [Leptospira saintgironsiae]
MLLTQEKIIIIHAAKNQFNSRNRIRRITIGASASLRACLRNSRSGYATFASVTSFAGQTRAVANVGTPWSLGEIIG